MLRSSASQERCKPGGWQFGEWALELLTEHFLKILFLRKSVGLAGMSCRYLQDTVSE